MKRHVIGIAFFIGTILLGFGVAPIRFIREGVGSGTVGGESFCSYSVYSSTQFGRVSSWSCGFEDSLNAEKYFKAVESKSEIISTGVNQILVKNKTVEANYFCRMYVEKNLVLDICSDSLKHLTEFEKQKSTKLDR